MDLKRIFEILNGCDGKIDTLTIPEYSEFLSVSTAQEIAWANISMYNYLDEEGAQTVADGLDKITNREIGVHRVQKWVNDDKFVIRHPKQLYIGDLEAEALAKGYPEFSDYIQNALEERNGKIEARKKAHKLMVKVLGCTILGPLSNGNL